MINGMNIMQYVIGGAVIFVLIALMGSLIVLAMTKKRGSEEAYTLVEEEDKKGILGALIAKMTYCEPSDEADDEDKLAVDRVSSKQVVEKTCDKKEIIFTKLGNQQTKESFRMSLQESLSIGRGINKNDWVIVNDQTVSQKHCKIYVEEGKLYIIDLNTTNGTYVNKERITKPVIINNQDNIRMGVSEYRITIIE